MRQTSTSRLQGYEATGQTWRLVEGLPASVASWAMPTDRLLFATCLYSVHPVPWPPPFPTFDYCPISYRDMWSAAPGVLLGCQVDAAAGGPAALGGRHFAPPGVEGAQPVHHDTSIQAIHRCFRRGQGSDDRRDRLDDRFRDATHDLRLIQHRGEPSYQLQRVSTVHGTY